MNILILGAGPAGLMFASQLKKAKPEYTLQILEKNRPEDTVGWGVVLPGRAPHHPANPLSYLPDHEKMDAQYLENFKLANNDDTALTSTGITLCGVERKLLVHELRELCLSQGIQITYESSLDDAAIQQHIQGNSEYDLIVMSNGINHVADYGCDALKPTTEFGKNRYMWYGTTKTFDAMNLIFRTYENHVFIAHSYKYSSTMSTFVVECSEETYQHFGMEDMSAEDCETFIAKVFKDELDAKPLITQAGLKWRNFMTLSHDNAYAHNIALLGDALQSGHFSIGHGTTMAVVEAQVLVKALTDHAKVQDALEDFNQHIMPVVKLFHQHATASRLWFENASQSQVISPLSADDIAQQFVERRGQLPPLPPVLAQTLGKALGLPPEAGKPPMQKPNEKGNQNAA